MVTFTTDRVIVDEHQSLNEHLFSACVTEGQVDYRATEEVQWQSHLVQLVPCAMCGRTFTPDRVVVHEKCCKGPQRH